MTNGNGKVRKNGKKKLTQRQKKLIALISENLSKEGLTKPMGELMREAGYSDSQSRAPSRIVGTERFQAHLENIGINDEKLGQVLKDGLDATKVISANVIAPDGEGMKDANSMTKDFIDVPDYFIRHKYLDTALKIKGMIQPEKDGGSQLPPVLMPIIKVDSVNIHFEVGTEKETIDI